MSEIEEGYSRTGILCRGLAISQWRSLPLAQMSFRDGSLSRKLIIFLRDPELGGQILEAGTVGIPHQMH